MRSGVRTLCTEQNCLTRIQVAPCASSPVGSDSEVIASEPSQVSKDGKAAVRINYPEDDAQCRESYVGSVVRQRPHGYGLLKWRKGNYVRFEGEFKAGDMRHGTLYFGPNGKSTYKGNLRQCRAEGIGELAPDEADDNVLQFYEGGWHNGLKNGWGTARYRNGDVYEGTWRDNKMFGNGTYTWSDGTVFAGQFEDDEMHGDGVCCWSNGLRVDLTFTHCYPNHVRSAVRVLCGILLLCTLVYVMPHLVDMTSASATPSEVQFSERAAAATYGADGQHCDYIVREAPPLSTRVYELFQWPWAWLWPWSTQQLEARAQARHEALILAMGGLKGVHIKGLWGASDSADVREGAPTGCMDTSFAHRDGGDRVLAMASDSSAPGQPAAAIRVGEAGLDDEEELDLDDTDDSVPSGVPSPHGTAHLDNVWGDQDDADEDDMLNQAYSMGVFDPAAFFDDGSDLVPARAQSPPANVSGPGPTSDGGDDGVCGSGGCAANSVAGEPDAAAVDAGAYGDDADGFGDELASDSEDDDGGSTILTVLTLYLRLHLKRQLHYLRLGMLALFTLTGDLEDAMSALVWPLLCIVGRTCTNRRFVCGHHMDRPLFWVALTAASSAVAFICVFVVVVVPEAVAEVVRLSCMNGLVAVPVDAAVGAGGLGGAASGLL